MQSSTQQQEWYQKAMAKKERLKEQRNVDNVNDGGPVRVLMRDQRQPDKKIATRPKREENVDKKQKAKRKATSEKAYSEGRSKSPERKMEIKPPQKPSDRSKKGGISSLDKAVAINQIITQADGLRKRKKSHRKDTRTVEQRRKALISDKEIKSILEVLGPIYRRRIFIEQLKSRWYLIVAPVALVIILAVIVGVVIVPLFTEVPTTFTPPEPVKGLWKVYELKGYDLKTFAKSWGTWDTEVWIDNTLIDKMMPIYDSLRYPILNITVLKLQLQSSPDARMQNRGRSTDDTSVLLEHFIYFSANKEEHMDVNIDLVNMMKTVRRNLIASVDWRIDPSYIIMEQAGIFVRSSSVREFMNRNIPPVNAKDIRLPRSRMSVVEPIVENYCDPVFIPPLTEVLPYNCTFISIQFPPGTKCEFSCPAGYVLLGSSVRACLPSGVWEGHNPRCTKPCKPLPAHPNGYVGPRECLTNDSVTQGTRCTYLCNEHFTLTRHVAPLCNKDGSWTAQPPLCKRQCPPIRIPDEMAVAPASCTSKPSLEGTVCVFSCGDNTILYGETSISCDSDGSWTEEVPVCRTKCPKLESVPNSDVHPTACDQEELFDGMACMYHCHDCFRLVGMPSRSCTSSGNWTGSPPRCSHTCEILDSPANGDVVPLSCTSTRVASGTVCRLSCDSGYAANGPTNLTCTENGVWDEPQPKCLVQCPALKKPSNSDLACTGHSEESTCALYCLPGHRLKNSGFVMCQADGTWTEPIGKCEKVCPTLQAPDNAAISPLECTVVESTLDFVCEVTCELSYGISGSAKRICTSNGTWSGEAATCTYEKQFQLVLEHKGASVCIASHAKIPKKIPSDQCEMSHSNLWSIHQGHLLKNSKDGLCLGFDTLTDMAKTVLLKCNASDPRQSWEWPDTTSENYTLKIRDKDMFLWYGYRTSDKMYGVDEAKPLSNWLLKDLETKSTYSFFGAAQNGHCPMLDDIANGKWSPTSCGQTVKSTGSLCSFLCDPGYEILSGTSVVTCSNGLWDGSTSPKCVPSCLALDGRLFNNGSVSPPTCFTSAYMLRGSTCAFQCETGFVLVGERNIACTANAKWTAEQPRCQSICPPIMLPAHGRIAAQPATCPNPTGMSDEGSVCRIECQNGYALQGGAVVLCTHDGSWNETTQKCMRTCLQPKTPHHGAIDCDTDFLTYPIGTNCTHSCLGGRSLFPHESVNVTCVENGIWNIKTPTCQFLCPPLVPSANATVSPGECTGPRGLENGKVCRFSCAPDFTLSSTAQAVCLSSGDWTVSTATCLPSHHFQIRLATNAACVAVNHYTHHNSYFVVKRPLNMCSSSNVTSQWFRTSTGQLEHVHTGWCLTINTAQNNEVVRLAVCDSSDPNQRWDCGITKSAFSLYLKDTGFMLQVKENLPSVFISKISPVNEGYISWFAAYNDGNNGSVCGTILGASASCPKIALTKGTGISPFICQASVDMGTNCTVTCDYGYELNSGAMTASTQCMDYGKWSSLDVFCKRRRCKALVLPTGATVSNPTCNSADVLPWSNVTCEVTCGAAYRKLQPGATGKLHCLGNGVWSEPMPQCFSFCPALAKPTIGKFSPEVCCNFSNKEGDRCDFSCPPHYRLVGSNSLECSSGAWSHSPAVCQPLTAGPRVCPSPSAPNYGYIVPVQCILSNVPFNQSCTVSCVAGYEALPQNVASFCQADGSWSVVLPKCKRTCPNFDTPMHASVFPDRCTVGINADGDQCTIACNPGFSTTEHRVVTCTSSGQWDSFFPLCIRVSHFLISIPKPALCLTAAETPEGVISFAACSYDNPLQKWEWLHNRQVRNYALQMCLSPAEDRSYASLNLSSCESLTSEWMCAYSATTVRQEFRYDTFVLGSSVVNPEVAFVLDPDQDEKSWVAQRNTLFYGLNQTAAGTICSFRSAGICMGMPPIENGLIETGCEGNSDHIRKGTTCHYDCETEYQLVGKPKRVCQGNGIWSDVSSVFCYRTCPHIEPVLFEVSPSLCRDTPYEGVVCTFVCEATFELSGPTSRVCQVDGTWSEEEVICHKNCPAHLASDLVIADPENCLVLEQTSGSVCRFSCPNGYILVVSAVHTCLNDGTWSSETPTCTRSCPALKPIANGRLLPTNCAGSQKGTGDACVYSCDGARSLDGNRIRSCTGSGIWTGSQPSCRTTCPPLTVPPNGKVHCSREVPLSGDTCSYSCLPNNVLEGIGDDRTCMPSGRWSGSEPSCSHEFQFMIFQSTPPTSTSCMHATSLKVPAMKDIASCSFQSSSDRWAWYQGSHIRNAATRLCLTGHIHIAEAYVALQKCDETNIDQKWECSSPDRPWFFRLEDTGLYPVGLPFSTKKILLHSDEDIDFIISTNAGITRHTSFYAKTSLTNRTYVCSARRENTCLPVALGENLINHPNECAEKQSAVGTQCHFTCKPGYMIRLEITSLRCLKSGRWSNDVPTCIQACNPLEPKAGDKLKIRPPTCAGTSTLPEKFACYGSCPAGFALVGQAVLTCLRSHEWDAGLPTCKAICPTLSPLEHGEIKPDECTDYASPNLDGARCTYTCLQEEHVLSGAAVRTCTPNGQWDKREPSCVKPCPSLPAPDGGKVLPGRCSEEPSLAETVCAFSCSEGLFFIGSAYRVCQANGSWTGVKSICQTPCPMAVTSTDNFLLEPVMCTHELVTPGLTCKCICKPGFQLQGAEQMTCMDSGMWSNQLGECLRRCPKLAKPANGQVLPPSCLGGDLFDGQVCKFTCQTQHILAGSEIRVCTENGTWTGNDTQCLKACNPIAEVTNVEFEPLSCTSELHVVDTKCLMFCTNGTDPRVTNRERTLKCLPSGDWDRNPLPICYQKCPGVTVQHGELTCKSPGDHLTTRLVEGIRCSVACDEDYVPNSYITSLCLLSQSGSPEWSPPVAECVYEPDPMVIINRIEFAAYCLGETDFRVTLVTWEQCAEESGNTRWTWQDLYLIRNANSGRCIAAPEAKTATFLVTKICNETDPLQQWDCDDDQPYCLRMRQYDFYMDTSREKFAGVLLQTIITPNSLLFTYNPETESETGTVCSRRKRGQCPALRFPVGANPLQEGCGADLSDVHSSCKVRCLYSLDDVIDVTCNASGTWDPDLEIECAPACRTPPDLQSLAGYKESECQQSKVPPQTVCTLTCPDTHTLIGNDTNTTCLEDLRWAPINDYDCITTCPLLKKPKNGRLNYPSCSIGVCSVKCDPDYRLIGSKSRECLPSGQWSGDPFFCVPEFQFRVVSANRYQKQTVCLTVTDDDAVVKSRCISNYHPQLWRWVSRSTLQSVDNNKCLSVNETALPPHDPSKTFLRPYRDIAESDYPALSTDGSRIRRSVNGSVNNTLPPVTSNNSYGAYDTSMFNGSLLFRTGSGPIMVADCNTTDVKQRWDCASMPLSTSQPFLKLTDVGLYLDAGPVYHSGLDVKEMALKSSEWYGGHYTGNRGICGFRSTGVCSPLTNPYGGSVTPNLCKSELVVEGTRCKFHCDKDFAIQGERFIFCEHSGKWSAEAPMCVGSGGCPALKPVGRYWFRPLACKQQEMPVGVVCLVKCPDNTITLGSNRLSCLDGGKWSGSLPTCATSCTGIQPPANGILSPDTCEHDWQRVGTTCTSACEHGYSAVGDVVRTCLDDGLWSGKRVDCLQLCPPLGKLLNGNTLPISCESNVSLPGQLCRFSCSRGHFLEGTKVVTCNEGKWTKHDSRCVGDWCPRIHNDPLSTEEIRYEQEKNGVVAIGSSLTITCMHGYKLAGPKERVCQADRSWTSGNKTCEVIKCLPLLRLYHRKVSTELCHSREGVLPKTICQFSCEDSFLLVGPDSVECQLGGVWSHTELSQCHDTLVSIGSTTFSMLFRHNLAEIPEKDRTYKCLKSTENTRIELTNCDGDDPFQKWHWFGSDRLKNVASQLCLGRRDIEHVKSRLIGKTCNLNDTLQIVRCGDIGSKLLRSKLIVGGLYYDAVYLGRKNPKKQYGSWFASTAKPVSSDGSDSKYAPKSTFRICSFFACGGELNGTEGDFSTPGFPNLYPNNILCAWHIQSSAEKRTLHIHFSSVSLKNPPKGKGIFDDASTGETANAFDNLVVYEDGTTDGNVLARVESNSGQFGVATPHGRILVQFYSDNRKNERANGISAHWFTTPWPDSHQTCATHLPSVLYNNSTLVIGSRWQTMVIYKQYFACNAFLVSDRALLVSAHCIDHYASFDDVFQVNSFRIVVGFKDHNDVIRKKERETFPTVSNIFLHPNFSRLGLTSDVAVVLAEHKLKFSRGLRPICLPTIDRGIVKPGLYPCWTSQWVEDMLFSAGVSKEWQWTRIKLIRILGHRSCATILQNFDTKHSGEFLCGRIYGRQDLEEAAKYELSTKPSSEGLLLQCAWNGNWYAVGLSTVALLEKDDVYVFTNIQRSVDWIEAQTNYVPYLVSGRV